MSKVDVERISCPVLCMVGTGEADTFKKQTYACYAALRSPKALRVVLQVLNFGAMLWALVAYVLAL
jgi:hypothetical protein